MSAVVSSVIGAQNAHRAVVAIVLYGAVCAHGTHRAVISAHVCALNA